ncbi:hypothetical protein ACWDCX_27235 [Streptomyces fungicidicus]|uniref:hypothetical protein n=1 Tax=Streptomyces fungicidicus TaxID=68203 RepID=UPI0036D09B0D
MAGTALVAVVVTAVALSGAGSAFTAKPAGADLTAGQLAAAREIASAGGPIAVNSLPPGAPGSAAHGVALEALGSGFGTAYLVCAVAAAVAAALTAFGMIGLGRSHAGDEESGAAPSAADGRAPDPAAAR